MAKYPNLSEEKRLWKKGYKIVVGLDEAGRGPLAGPVVAGAVTILDTKYQIPDTKIEIRDSKQLSFLQREKLYKIIVKDSRLRWGIGIVSEKIIDRINILEATKLAMKKAVKNLQRKLKKGKSNIPQKFTIVKKRGKIDFLILDGNFKLNLLLPQKPIVKGDEKVFSCAAASIVAKVTRDRIMLNYHRKYPRYRFDLHKGYPTKLHLKMLKKYGSCPIHRKTFSPVSAPKTLAETRSLLNLQRPVLCNFGHLPKNNYFARI
jgi:ribonuclease HII